MAFCFGGPSEWVDSWESSTALDNYSLGGKNKSFRCLQSRNRASRPLPRLRSGGNCTIYSAAEKVIVGRNFCFWADKLIVGCNILFRRPTNWPLSTTFSFRCPTNLSSGVDCYFGGALAVAKMYIVRFNRFTSAYPTLSPAADDTLGRRPKFIFGCIFCFAARKLIVGCNFHFSGRQI